MSTPQLQTPNYAKDALEFERNILYWEQQLAAFNATCLRKSAVFARQMIASNRFCLAQANAKLGRS